MPISAKTRAMIDEVHRAQKMLLDAGITAAVAVPVEQLVEMYERFCRLTQLGQTNIDDLGKTPKEIMELRSKIFSESDFGAMFAGQWLPKEARNAARERLRLTSQ